MSILSFDPSALSSGWLRVIRGVASAGAIVFGLVTAYLYFELQRTSAVPGQDIMAMLALLKFLFLFVIIGVTGTIAVTCAFIAVRCWLART